MDVKNIVRKLDKFEKEKDTFEKVVNLGSICRAKRLELKMSQSDVCNKICSVSYLSKIEANKINPNQRTVSLLMEKMKISNWDIYVIENGKELVRDMIEYIYNYEVEEARILFEQIINVENNPYSYLLKASYYFLREDYERMRLEINNALPIIQTLDKESTKLLAYLSGELNLYLHRYDEAEKISDSLNTYSTSEKLEVLIDYFKFKLYVYTNRPLIAIKKYERLISNYSSRMNFRKIFFLELNYAFLLYQNHNYELSIEVLNVLLNKKEYDRYDEICSLLALSFLKLNKTITAKQYFDKISKTSKVYPYLSLMFYTNIQDKNEYIEEIKELNSRNRSFYFDYLILLHNKLLTRDIFETDLFINQYSMSYTIEKIHLLELERSILISLSRYKESNILSDKIISYLTHNIL